jgi:hypothetical protein
VESRCIGRSLCWELMAWFFSLRWLGMASGSQECIGYDADIDTDTCTSKAKLICVFHPFLNVITSRVLHRFTRNLNDQTFLSILLSLAISYRKTGQTLFSLSLDSTTDHMLISEGSPTHFPPTLREQSPYSPQTHRSSSVPSINFSSASTTAK